jgi:GNAT superfamily N-acetyltransferase
MGRGVEVIECGLESLRQIVDWTLKIGREVEAEEWNRGSVEEIACMILTGDPEAYGRYLHITLDGRPVGQILMQPIPINPHYGGALCLIDDVYIEPDYRTLHLFSRLFKDVERRAQQSGAIGCQLIVKLGNTLAQGAYEREGFFRNGHVIEGKYFDMAFPNPRRSALRSFGSKSFESPAEHGLSISPATLKDIDLITAWTVLLGHEVEQAEWDQESIARYVRMIIAEECPETYYLLRVNGQPVGQVLIQRLPPNPSRGGIMWQIADVYVERNFRGFGLFSHLYRYSETVIVNQNTVGIRLVNKLGNQCAERAFGTQGFLHDGHVLMQKLF